MRKLSRKQRLKVTGQYYTAPRGFFSNMSQEMSQSAHKAADREAAAAAAPEGADDDAAEALSIEDDDQTEPGLLPATQGLERCTCFLSMCQDLL